MVTGCNFVVLLKIKDCKKLPSINWIRAIDNNVNIPIVGLCEKPTITAGAPPIYGPAYGIILVKPQNKPNNNGARNPTIQNTRELIIKIKVQSKIDPWTNPRKELLIADNNSFVPFWLFFGKKDNKFSVLSKLINR